MKIPLLRSLCGSKDTPKFDQFLKFKQDVVFMSMESKFGFYPHWQTVESPGWLYPEAQSLAAFFTIDDKAGCVRPSIDLVSR